VVSTTKADGRAQPGAWGMRSGDAIALEACGTVFDLASDASERGLVQLGDAGDVAASNRRLVGDPEGGTYFAPCFPEQGCGLEAYDPDGSLRWRLDAIAGWPVAGPSGPYVQFQNTLTAYAATDGALRWSYQPAAASWYAVARPKGGVFVVSLLDGGVEVAAIDDAGMRTGTVTLVRGYNPGTPAIYVMPTPDDTAFGLFVSVGGRVELGGLTFNGTDGHRLLAMMAVDGTLRWVYQLPDSPGCSPGVSPCENIDGFVALDDRIVVGGEASGWSGLPASTPYASGYIGVFGANGLDHVVPVLGPASVYVVPFAVEPDGSVWANIPTADGVYTGVSDVMVGSTGIQIGGTSYINGDDSSRGYFVNLVP
jgi:outer membrane protein assembly factor BamB